MEPLVAVGLQKPLLVGHIPGDREGGRRTWSSARESALDSFLSARLSPGASPGVRLASPGKKEKHPAWNRRTATRSEVTFGLGLLSRALQLG